MERLNDETNSLRGHWKCGRRWYCRTFYRTTALQAVHSLFKQRQYRFVRFAQCKVTGSSFEVPLWLSVIREVATPWKTVKGRDERLCRPWRLFLSLLFCNQGVKAVDCFRPLQKVRYAGIVSPNRGSNNVCLCGFTDTKIEQARGFILMPSKTRFYRVTKRAHRL